MKRALAYLRSFLAKYFLRSRVEKDLEEELRSHIQLRVDDLTRSGMDRIRAERQARIEFGGTERFKEECREALGGSFLDVLIQDVRFSLRTLRKSPGFTAVVIGTMAFGIGATAAIFSLVEATLVRPPPYPQPDQLVRIEDDLPGIEARAIGMSEPEWQDLQHSGIFQYVSPAWYDDNNLSGGSRPERVSLLIVAPNYFTLLRVKPQLGRTFPPADHSPGFTTEVVISDSLWKRIFAGTSDILGKSIRIDTDLYRIVGVMPPDFRDPATTAKERNIEVWAATSFYGPPLLDQPLRNRRNLPTAVARLREGLTIEAAQSALDTLVASLQKQFPEDYPSQARWHVRLVPLKESLVGNVRQPLLLLLAAMGFVLVIGCVNIANLLLARASTRGREMAIREALGASRSRLAQQLLTESLLLSVTGGITGFLVLFLTKQSLLQLLPENMPRFNDVSISWGVVLFGLLASCASGLIFGLAPALHAGGGHLTVALKQEGRGSTSTVKQARTRAALVVTEFAFSLVLLVAAGLLFHSFWDLLNTRLGFDPSRVLTIQTRLPYPNDPKNDVYPSAAEQTPFFREILRRCGTMPGVEEVAFGDLGSLPLGHDRNNQNPPLPIFLEGDHVQDNEAPLVDESIVTPGYFHLLGMSLLRGRLFNDFDDVKAEPVAIINESMSQTFWPNESPLGKHVKVSRRTTAAWTTIVGVVANARTEMLAETNVPQIYTNLYQRGAKHLAIFMRGNLDSGTPEAVRKVVQSLDSSIPVFGARPLAENVSASFAQRRFSLEMVALFAVVALLLAAVGIYGVISYIVAERTHEIGIRLALGARHSTILGMVLRQGLRLTFTGTGLGLVFAITASQLMKSVLYGTKATDPLTFVGVALLLTGVGLLACYIPARRAMRMDAMTALRHE